VIQPHLPIRLPCYDFTPITSPTFDGCLRSRSKRQEKETQLALANCQQYLASCVLFLAS